MSKQILSNGSVDYPAQKVLVESMVDGNDMSGRVKRVNALGDLRRGLGLWRYWSLRSWLNYKFNFKGTKLGVLWPWFSVLIFVGMLALVWGVILDAENIVDYFLYLLVGFPVWQVMANSVERANQTLDPSIASSGLPLSVILFERACTPVIALANVLPLIIFTVLLTGNVSVYMFLQFMVAIIFVLFWCIGGCFLVTVLANLLPDFRHFLTAIMRMAFLATPIVWEVGRLGNYQNLIWLNPFYLPLGFARSALSMQETFADFIVWAPLYCFIFFLFGMTVFILAHSSIMRKVN